MLPRWKRRLYNKRHQMSTDRDIEQATTVNEHPIKPLEKDLTH